MNLIYDDINTRVVLEDDSEVAFYTNTFNSEDEYCSDKVVNNVINMYNNKNSSKNILIEIDAYLLDENECTQDSREIIMEGLFLLIQKV